MGTWRPLSEINEEIIIIICVCVQRIENEEDVAVDHHYTELLALSLSGKHATLLWKDEFAFYLFIPSSLRKENFISNF